MGSQIRLPDGSRYPVKDWVSKDGAETYESSKKKFYKIGAEEGRSKTIQKVLTYIGSIRVQTTIIS
jgi:hypothetical protein